MQNQHKKNEVFYLNIKWKTGPRKLKNLEMIWVNDDSHLDIENRSRGYKTKFNSGHIWGMG